MQGDGWQGECFEQYTQYRLKYDNLKKKKKAYKVHKVQKYCVSLDVSSRVCPGLPVIFVRLNNPAAGRRMKKKKKKINVQTVTSVFLDKLNMKRIQLTALGFLLTFMSNLQQK